MSRHERNREGSILPAALFGGVITLLAATHGLFDQDPSDYVKEGDTHNQPGSAPTAQESFDLTNTKDHYGLKENSDGIIEVFKGVLSPDASQAEPIIEPGYEEPASGSGFYPAEVIQPGEGSPKIVPLNPGEYAVPEDDGN